MPTTTAIKKRGPGKPKGVSSGPIADYQKEFVVHMGVLGKTRSEIVIAFAARYNRSLNPRTISKIWKDNKDKMNEAQTHLATQGMTLVSGDSLKQKSYKILDGRLSRAQADESDIEKLRIRLRAGEITKRDFDAECDRYEQLTINELVKIADMGFEHAHKANEGPALTPEDQATLDLLTQGLRNGNPLQLIQVLNPQMKVYPNGESSVHSAGTP